MTPYEQGMIDGQWSDEQITQCGFTSAEECLAHQEQVLQEEKENLPSLYEKNPAYAKQHAEYLEGLESGTYASLRGK